MRLGEKAKVQVEVIPTGSIALDLALGVGGVPRGRSAVFVTPFVERAMKALRVLA